MVSTKTTAREWNENGEWKREVSIVKPRLTSSTFRSSINYAANQANQPDSWKNKLGKRRYLQVKRKSELGFCADRLTSWTYLMEPEHLQGWNNLQSTQSGHNSWHFSPEYYAVITGRVFHMYRKLTVAPHCLHPDKRDKCHRWLDQHLAKTEQRHSPRQAAP